MQDLKLENRFEEVRLVQKRKKVPIYLHHLFCFSEENTLKIIKE